LGEESTHEVAIPDNSNLRFRPVMPKVFLIQPLSLVIKSLMVKMPKNLSVLVCWRPMPQMSSMGVLPIVWLILSGRMTKMPPVDLALSLASLAKVLDVLRPIDTGILVCCKMVWRIFVISSV